MNTGLQGRTSTRRSFLIPKYKLEVKNMRKNTLTGCQQDLLDYLGKQYTVKRIDGLDCIYRDFGDYDVEICGG